MKKNKIIGLLVGCGGVIASFAGAFALSVKNATDVQFVLTAKSAVSEDGGIDYSFPDYDETHPYIKEYVSTNGSDHAGAKLDATYTQIHYAFKLGGNYVSPAPAQDFVVGNLSFTFSNFQPGVSGNVKIYAVVNGYTDDTVGKSTYEHIFYGGEYHDVADTTIALESEQTTFTLARDLCVAANGTNSLDVYIKFDAEEMNDILFACNEESPFELDIVWGAPSNDFVAPVIRGDGNAWAESNAYMMLPNINRSTAQGWEWFFKGLTGFEKFKLYKESTWIGKNAAGTGTVSGNEGLDVDGLTKGSTYNIYWDGTVGDGHPIGHSA